jgi:hypothetical protein
MKYQALYDLTLAQGGVTLRVKDYPEQIVMPTKGYAVGNGAKGIALTFGSDLEAFDVSVERVIAQTKLIGADYFGTWIDTSTQQLYIDPVNVFASKDFALGVAFERGELAVYDLDKQREIRIKRGKE